MQMKNRKRFLALVAAAAMAIAPCSAFASNVTNSAIDGVGGQGTGTNEGWLDKTYFKVEYPTVADGELDFIIDAQQLIESNKGASLHGSEKFETGATLFFKTDKTVDSQFDWTHMSKDYTLKIWSSTIVNVSVSAKVSSGSIEVATNKSFTGNAKPSIYMAIEKAADDGSFAVAPPTYVVEPSKKIGSMDVTVAALAASDFQVSTATGSYIFELADPDSATKVKTVKFRLTGAANSNADAVAAWKDYVDVKPTVDLVWSVKPDTGMQTVSATGDPLKWANRAQDYTFKVDLSAAGATAIKDVGVSYNGKVHTFNGTWAGGTTSLKNQGWAEISTDTVTLKPGLSQYLPAGDRLFVRLETASGDKVIQLTAE